MAENEQYKPSESEARSLDLLHEGQEAALKGDMERAMEKFVGSLAAAKEGVDLEWVSYLEGTIAYLNSDLIEVRAQALQAGDNSEVLVRLADGLAKRGTPDYEGDYWDQNS